MIICLCSLQLYLGWSNSLKDKRREIKSLMKKAQSKFNISIAETDDQDNWRTATIGFAAVSSERRHADSIINEVVKFIEQNTEAEIISCKTEIL